MRDCSAPALPWEDVSARQWDYDRHIQTHGGYSPVGVRTKFASRPFDPPEQGNFDALHAFGCNGTPPANKPNRRVEAAYAAAQTQMYAGHWEEAAVGFDDIARLRNSESGGAAQLALQALNVLSTTFNRRDCEATMRELVPQYRSLLCGSPAIAPAMSCKTFADFATRLEERRK